MSMVPYNMVGKFNQSNHLTFIYPGDAGFFYANLADFNEVKRGIEMHNPPKLQAKAGWTNGKMRWIMGEYL